MTEDEAREIFKRLAHDEMMRSMVGTLLVDHVMSKRSLGILDKIDMNFQQMLANFLAKFPDEAQPYLWILKECWATEKTQSIDRLRYLAEAKLGGADEWDD